MKPFMANNEAWMVVRVLPGDPRLVDRIGKVRVATTDPATRTVHISSAIVPPLLDRVMLHEVAHAITISYGLLEPLHAFMPEDLWIPMEEWSAQLVEAHGIEAVIAASESLGRPLCIRGLCAGV